ncbi:MAG: metallophosphoesterase family protein [Clostridia bacterium]|nr:metallophosphoesterase family protein [Clostridia bacterium]
MEKEKVTASFQTEGAKKLTKELQSTLKGIVSPQVYETFVDHFVYETINENEIVVGYYGSEPLKNLKKEDKDLIWTGICSVAGESEKFRIEKRTEHSLFWSNPKVQKHLKIAKLFVISVFFAGIALAIALVTGNYIGNRNFRETFYAVSSIKADNPIRVIQISDLHNINYGKENQKLLTRVEKLNPDIILLTGDILDSYRNRQEQTVALCSNLSRIAPSYYIYGNNEVEKIYGFPLTKEELDAKFGFSDENRDWTKLLELEDSFAKALEEGGVKVLKNQTDTLTVGTTEIDVFGVLTSNPSSFWNYADQTFLSYVDTNTSNLKITAVHEPHILEEFQRDFWGDLVVCGHTHGGTIRVPMLGPMYTHEGGLFPERKDKYVYGRYPISGGHLIVSGGLENKNIFRINNQPELVIIDINKF